MSSNRFVVARLLAGILAANCLQMAISSTVRADIVRGIPGTNAFSSASLPSYRYDDYDLEKYQSALNDVQRNYEQAQRVMDGANRDLQGAQSREDEINRSLNDQGRALEANTRKQADLSQAIVQKNNQLQSVQRDIPGLQNDVANLEREISSTQTVVQDLQNRLNAAAAADKPAIQAQLNTQTQILMQFKVTLSVKSKMLADANANLARLQAELSQTGPQMNALKGEENQLRGRIAE
ncbi:MAG TPA: hypothetical protein VN132_05535, partial [Bdellovibrio sp.]|nr:hypothetical protein [Bdellovibrio sp.]